MVSIRPNNRNPKSGLIYDEIFAVLIDEIMVKNSNDVEVGAGNNTVAYLDSDGSIMIRFHDTVVARLIDEDTVQLFSGGWEKETTKRRLDWAVFPIGYRVKSVRRKLKVYSINTGAYWDYMPGMTITRNRF